MFCLVPPTTIIFQIHKRRTDNTILNYSCFQMENSNSFLFILWIKRHIKWFNAFSDKVYSVCLWQNFFPLLCVIGRYNRFVHINYTIMCYKQHSGILHFVALNELILRLSKWGSFLLFFLGYHCDHTLIRTRTSWELLQAGYRFWYIIRNKDSF